MKTRFFFLSISVIGSLISCVNDPNVFTENQSKVKQFGQETVLKGEVFIDDEYGILDMIIVGDYLVLTSTKREHIFHVYNPKKQFVGAFGTIGRGPNELLNCRYTGQSDTERIWINDVSQSRLLHINIAKSLEAGFVLCEDTVPTSPSSANCYYVNDSLIYMERILSDNYEMVKYNYDLKYLSEKDLLYHPGVTSPFSYYKSMWRKHPEDNRMVGAMHSINQLNIFEPGKNNRKAVVIGEKSVGFSEAVDKETGLETHTYYCDINVTSDRIYALYMDQSYDDSYEVPKQQEVHVFNWEGNPIQKFLLPQYIFNIVVDESSKCMYGISNEEIIYKYDLSDLL